MVQMKTNIIGNKYGKLTVIKQVEDHIQPNGTLVPQFECLCDCGNTCVEKRNKLLYKAFPTCGCEIKRGSNKIDLTGQRFGRLTVIREVGRNAHNEILWECLCDCGNIVVVAGYALRSGHTQSCGCYMKDRIIETCKKYNPYDLSGEYGVGWTFNTNAEFYFDIEDYDKIKDYCWYEDAYGYIATDIDGVMSKMHRVVMGVTDRNIQVDHKHHNKKDNRKSKLRLCKNQQNAMNRIPKADSGYNGVIYNASAGKWNAQITYNYQTYQLGSFVDIEDAIAARLKAEEKYFGKWSYTESNKEVIAE